MAQVLQQVEAKVCSDVYPCKPETASPEILMGLVYSNLRSSFPSRCQFLGFKTSGRFLALEVNTYLDTYLDYLSITLTLLTKSPMRLAQHPRDATSSELTE